jgi:hypothetical protein
MHGIKTLFASAALVAGLALAPAAQSQVVIQIGGNPPNCAYGYYGYAPYACAPSGYYGPGYFYNGIFLGMGPWGGWGYSHGWGSHRFVSEGGGRYHGGPSRVAYRSGGARPSASHSAPAHSSAPRASHAAPSRAAASHAPASHGGASHGGGHEDGGKR